MILIIGGEGFVGSAFSRYCQRQGIDHAIVGRHNYDQFVGQRCEILINANGNSKKLRAREHPLLEFEESVRSVRASLVHFPADYYVYLSTCDVYPDCSSPGMTSEERRLDVTSQSPYGFHKYLAEQCVRHAGGHWLILRLGGLVGPGLKKNAIFDILQGGPLWLDPGSELQYLATDDAARIAFELIDRGEDRQVFNVCGKGLIQLTEVIKAAGRSVTGQPGSPRVRYDVAIEKLERLMAVPETQQTLINFVRSKAEPRPSRSGKEVRFLEGRGSASALRGEAKGVACR
jgi:nucleoside-diphosphate-sugar epimerase